MGFYPRVIAGFGMMLNTDALKGAEVEEPSCEHPERVGQTFCPICGKKVGSRMVEDRERRSDFSIFFHEEMKLPKGWVEDMGEYTGAFVGVGFSSGDTGDVRFDPDFNPDRDAILTTIRETFAEWPEVIDETKLGFYLVNSGS